MYEFIKKTLMKIGLFNIARKIKYAPRDIRTYLFDKKHDKRANRIKEGKSFKDTKYIELQSYKNIHAGKRCFIISTGPSLKIEDVEKLKNEYTFSMNSITKLFDKTDWRPTYYAIQDYKVYKCLADDDSFKSIQKKFVADIIRPGQIKPYKIDENAIRFPLHMSVHDKFSVNAYEIVYEGSVTYSALQIAVYMGFAEIYLLGCDCNYSGPQKHFADYGLKSNYDPTQNMLLGFTAAKKYADTHDLKIFNATRGGKLEIFERVNFDNLFEDKC